MRFFLNRELDQSPEDELLLQVQGMIAEYERAKMLERSRRGKRHKAQQGAVNVLGGAPYGYRYVTVVEGGGQARYEIIDEQAQVVRQVFGWVGCKRWSIGEVRRRLTTAGVPSPRGKTWWDRTSLWDILKNPSYAGQAAFGKTRAGALRPRLRAQRSRTFPPAVSAPLTMSRSRNGSRFRCRRLSVRSCLQRCKRSWKKTAAVPAVANLASGAQARVLPSPVKRPWPAGRSEWDGAYQLTR